MNHKTSGNIANNILFCFCACFHGVSSILLEPKLPIYYMTLMWPIIEWKFYKNLYSRSMRSHWVFKCCAINNCALVEIFAEEGLFCCAFVCRNTGRKSNDHDFRRLVLVWSLKLLQAFGGFTSSSLAKYNPKIRNLFSIPSKYNQNIMNLWGFPNVPRSGNLIGKLCCLQLSERK